MTYKELLEQLQSLTPEQLNQTVTIKDVFHDEFHGVEETAFTDETVDVLDEGHFYLMLML